MPARDWRGKERDREGQRGTKREGKRGQTRREEREGRNERGRIR
jgi:hypothetical protein